MKKSILWKVLMKDSIKIKKRSIYTSLFYRKFIYFNLKNKLANNKTHSNLLSVFYVAY